MSASDTPKSRLETRSFPPVSTPAPGPKPLSKRSCCHFSGSSSVPDGASASCAPRAAASSPGPPPPPPRPAAPRPRPRPLDNIVKDMSILSPMMPAPSGDRKRMKAGILREGRGGRRRKNRPR
uniref:Uncharacterized protein n=1 Tax=Anolis carolinensis TaxID=28377 RepID=A0A803T5P6_ANOCA